jgi:hypothetical protein
MDNRQLRTAMASRILGRHAAENIFDHDPAAVEIESISQMSSAVKEWRNGLGTLSLGIGARGGAEGVWYVDLMTTPQSGFADLLLRFDDAVSSYMHAKNPKKLLCFTADGLSCIFFYKEMFPDSEIHFANTQSLFNFERFMRDESTPRNGGKLRDIEYSVVDENEIATGDASGYDFIQVASWDVLYDESLLKKCVSALADGGVLIVISTNHSGKVYRDDTTLHPYYSMHDVLKNSKGMTYHNSDSYGFTVFIKQAE